MHGRSRGAQQDVKKDGMKQKRGTKLVCARLCLAGGHYLAETDKYTHESTRTLCGIALA